MFAIVYCMVLLNFIVTLASSVDGDERNAAASDILARIKRDSDKDFAKVPRFPCLFVTFAAFSPHFPPDSCLLQVHNVLTEGQKLDQHYSFAAE